MKLSNFSTISATGVITPRNFSHSRTAKIFKICLVYIFMNKAITSMVLISFVVLLMFIVPLPHNAMQKPGSYQISPSVSSSSIPMWLFNGSYANYTGYYNGISMFENFSISKIDLSSGVYCVSIHTIYGGNLNLESHLNGTSSFTGANVSSLSCFNSGKEPPWINKSIFQTFIVNTGKIVNLRLGNYSADRVSYYAIQTVNSKPDYMNVSFYPETYSGLVLKENLSTHYGNTRNNVSISLNSTNVPLGAQATNPSGGPYVYIIIGGVVAAVAVSGGLIYFKKVKHKTP